MPKPKTTACPPVSPLHLAEALDLVRQLHAALPDQPRRAAQKAYEAIGARAAEPEYRAALLTRFHAMVLYLLDAHPGDMHASPVPLTVRAACIAAAGHRVVAGRLAPGFAGKVESVKSALIADQN